MVRLVPNGKKPKPFAVSTRTILQAAVDAQNIHVIQFTEAVAASLAAT